MPLEQNPYESPSHPQLARTTPVVIPIACALAGAFLCTVAFSQTFSTLGFFVDSMIQSGMLARLTGMAIGVFVGIPVGSVAGWLIGKGRHVNLRLMAIGSVLCCLIFSSVLLTSGGPTVVKILLPIFGLLSGAVAGAAVSVLVPPSVRS